MRHGNDGREGTGVNAVAQTGHRRLAVGRMAGDRRRVWPWRRTTLAALAVAACAAPFVLEPYRVFQLTMVLVYGIALLGLNLVVGHGGRVSLGHGAFLAIGAYIAAVMTGRLGVPYPLALPVAALVTFGLGLALGRPALRLSGPYLAVVTFVIAAVVPPVIKRFGTVTGGSMGLPVPVPSAPSWTGLAEDQWLYLLVLAVAAAAFAAARNLLESRAGRALTAVRENPHAAEILGVRPGSHRALAFGWSAMYAGVAGTLYAWVVGFVSPDSFTVTLSIVLLAAVVIGGPGSLAGPLLGAVFVTFVPAAAQRAGDALPGIVSGLLIIVVVCFAPTGLAGLLRMAAGGVARRLGRG
ncbi:branched-chain amino acid ABC transporter permease [Planobispora longispora]|uniref:Branched-chain amino acid ABC transporter permease n=1 Tax=Planobispora longispora TaxID=28887 RepID=A0A8J3RR48_9ACTN|nr:branched-chain amino acid ABC transporter permease [Planobispora longispora]